MEPNLLTQRIEGDLATFCDLLTEMHMLSPVHAKIMDMLQTIEPRLSCDAQKLLCLYFMRLDLGNTRLVLTPDRLIAQWKQLWQGSMAHVPQQNAPKPHDPLHALARITQQGVHDLLSQDYDALIERRTQAQSNEPGTCVKPFVMHPDGAGHWALYAVKYFNAKCTIEQAFHRYFATPKFEVLSPERDACRDYFAQKMRPECQIHLEERQIDAIVRGLHQNLVITGGPGTGKTTVIAFLLYQLLEKQDFAQWNVYLAAPSGKAADRMRESITESIKLFKDPQAQAYQKIVALESRTLHALLHYNPASNQFSYHAQNPFPDHSIFVIDEASMIDLDMFAKFLHALPPQNCRIFILGDANQLPSVDAGAVLGEILATKNAPFSIHLNKTRRFDDASRLGQLAKHIQNRELHWENDNAFAPYAHATPLWRTQKDERDRIHTIDLTDPNGDKLQEQRNFADLLSQWCTRFYDGYQDDLRRIDPLAPIEPQASILDAVWNRANEARILTAERQGRTGTQAINACICQILGMPSQSFAPGQLLMLTQNQAAFQLYNGDSGIVVREKNTQRLHLMLKKTRSSPTQSCDYCFYPLALLPAQALELAFAMTIHKSQGSGYPHILMFLPKTLGHPLLNNQIIYTGVTRTKEKSLTIVASKAAFEWGCGQAITRDTGIVL